MSRLLGKILFWLIAFVGLWLGGLLWFTSSIPQAPATNMPNADAIVALTGGTGRLDYGLQLLADGKGKALFITGVGVNHTVDSLMHQTAEPLRSRLEAMGNLPIFIGYEAENTIGNVMEARPWLESHHYKTVYLVTSNYHMPRSMEEFSEIMPGITFIPAPVFPDDFYLASWWMDAHSRDMVFSEYHKFIAAKLRHWFVAAVRRV